MPVAAREALPDRAAYEVEFAGGRVGAAGWDGFAVVVDSVTCSEALGVAAVVGRGAPVRAVLLGGCQPAGASHVRLEAGRAEDGFWLSARRARVVARGCVPGVVDAPTSENLVGRRDRRGGPGARGLLCRGRERQCHRGSRPQNGGRPRR